MQIRRAQKPSIFISHTADVRDWVRQFEVEINSAGFDSCTAHELTSGASTAREMMRRLRASDLVVAVADPDLGSSTPWVEFSTGVALGMGKDVWLVTPQPVNLESLGDSRFSQLLRAVGSHTHGSPSDIARRVAQRLERSDHSGLAKAS